MLTLLYSTIIIFFIVMIVYFFVFLELILFGSSIDPDDNGILRTKKQKEKFKQKKIEKLKRLK